MRLWHYKLIELLPRSQLIAQWRELNSIFKKQDKHILINYVYEYDKKELLSYTILVFKQMVKKNIRPRSLLNFHNYFGLSVIDLCIHDIERKYGKLNKNPFPNHHTNRYLLQCFYNLQEKYDRGQKDFSYEVYNKMRTFMLKEKLIDEIH